MKKYERFDNCYGTIVDKCFKGVFILLDNNEYAYASNFTCCRKGTRVLCTVLKEATDVFKTLVSIDSVITEYQFAA